MKKNLLKATTVAISLLAVAACSDTEDINGGVTKPQSYSYNVSLKVDNENAGDNANSAKAVSRTLGLDANNDVVSSWAANDKIFIYNLEDKEQSTESTYSMVTTQDAGGHTANFRGEVKSKNPIKQGDKLALFYPATALEDKYTVEQVDPNTVNEKDGEVDLNYHSSEINGQKVKIKSTVSLNMNEQDGMLSTIDKKFDYNWGTATLAKTPATSNDIELTSTLQRKVTIWGMKFKDTNGNAITDIKTVKINGVLSYDVLNLKDGSFVGTTDEKEYNINVSIANSSELSKQGGYVWVAFIGENKSTEFTVTVYTPNKVYTKTATKMFNIGYDYRTNITVKDIIAEPYVEVNGTKWATGNFIHYKTGAQEYWGIAPAQWWISNYADAPTADNKVGSQAIKYDAANPGSQFWYIGSSSGKYTQNPNDLDLFRYGDIVDALTLDKNLAYAGFTGVEISGKYYKGRLLPGSNITNNRNQAKYGDIVKYWTEDGNHNYYYAYPNKTQLEALLNSTTFVPGYCYTDKGNKIYGAYISDKPYIGSSAKFPTGKKLWKYQDVTGLVLANKGLFLPIAGNREDGSSSLVYRYIGQGSEFHAIYWSDHGTATSTGTGLKFGSRSKKWATPQRQAASCIRPVYVGENISGKPVDAANFAPFNHIITTTARLY